MTHYVPLDAVRVLGLCLLFYGIWRLEKWYKTVRVISTKKNQMGENLYYGIVVLVSLHSIAMIPKVLVTVARAYASFDYGTL